ncbi:MAG: DUF6114 domain-containing protein [Thermoplasmata archaeon]
MYEASIASRTRPTTAFALSLVAGIFILLNGIVIAVIGGFLLPLEAGLGIVFIVFGLVFGIVTLLGAIMLYVNPEKHVGWGTSILLFSIFSIVIGGGFLIGFILGIVGGSLAIAWKPTGAVPTGVRVCPGCGRQTSMEYAVCPYCGRPATLGQPYPAQPAPMSSPPPMQIPAAALSVQSQTPPAQAPAAMPIPPPQAPLTPRFCSDCGASLPPGANNCPSCGVPVH